MEKPPLQLVSYIAPGAPATRRPAEGDEPFVRPEIGFTPNWYRAHTGIDFGDRWHNDPAYRRDCVLAMREELRLRFPDTAIGGIDRPDAPLDLLTGLYGTAAVAGIYGVPLRYAADGWPDCERAYLTGEECDALRPPNLDTNPFFAALAAQVEWIAGREVRVEGFINWQGVFNNAHRLRGQSVFLDLVTAPDRCRRLFDCVSATMVDAAERLYGLQRSTGVTVDFFTVSNCLVNMISPQQYRDLLLPYDRRFAEIFGCLGVHNCAWTADPYLEAYAEIPNMAYLDMGLGSNLRRARELIPRARRALMYTPMDVAAKSEEAIRDDVERIARDYGPCDVVFADIEAGTSDERILFLVELCDELSRRWGS